MSFFGKNTSYKKNDDKIWFTTKYKLNGIIQAALQNKTANKVVMLVTFFEQSHNQLIDGLKEKQINFKQINEGDYFDQNFSDFSAFVLRYELLKENGSFKNLIKNFKNETIFFIFAEHYPLLTVQDKTLEFFDNQKDKKIEIEFHAALEEPILKTFSGDTVKDMLLKMGATENECFSHSMITKSIINAQKKLADKIIFEKKADSQESWFRINYQN